MIRGRLLPSLLLLLVAPNALAAGPGLPVFKKGIRAVLETALTVGRQRKVYERAVLLVGHRDDVPLVMTAGDADADSRFDIASLTKVISTTTQILRLVDEEKLALDPETVLLLQHRAGLKPGAPKAAMDAALPEFWNLLEAQLPRPVTDHGFRYSDVGFLLLGKKIEAATGRPLDESFRDLVARPLGLGHSGFLPEDPETCVPTSSAAAGIVHDPTVRKLGGVGGSAGLFASASDLGVYARMILNKGVHDGSPFLKPETVRRMTARIGLPTHQERGLGWDIDTPYSAPRGNLFPIGGFGHTGFTGTSLWIDPKSGIYIVLLTNRTYYGESNGNAIKAIRSRVATLVAKYSNRR